VPAVSPRTGRATTTLDVHVSATVASPVSRAEAKRLARAVLRAERVRNAMLSITFVGRRRIRSLNRIHFGRDRETDVIAFTMAGVSGLIVGDVYCAPEVGMRQAKRFGTSPAEEVRRLLVHGILHVVGYDHPEGDGRERSAMWRRQERLLAGRRRGR
jgi:probable rRNA maturation factor